MKYLIYTLAVAGMLLSAGSCSEQEIELYDGEEGVYFYNHPHKSVRDELVTASDLIEFGRLTEDTVELTLHVMITGRTKSYPRAVKVVIDADSTTAEVGLNYAPLADTYTVEAGATFVDIPLYLYDNENILQEEKRVDVRLLPTDDFIIGIPIWKASLADNNPVDLTRHTVYLTGFLPRPATWSGATNATTGVETSSLGLFGMKKFNLICEVCGVTYDDFLTFMPTNRITMIRVIMANYLTQMYEAHTPVLEDDGRLMWVSGVAWTSIPGVPWNGQY
jgi:hypothetical protein